LETRQALKVGNTQLHRFLNQLLDLEYIQIAGGHANRGYRYQVQYWDDNEKLRNTIKTHLDRQLEML